MAKLASVRTRLEPLQRETLASKRPRYLFRGASQIHPRVNSTFARIPTDEEIRIGQAYTTFRHAKQICTGLRGYTIDHLDGLALLQHYGWPTPLIDLTAMLEVAIFFSLRDAHPGQTAVIYTLDCEALPDGSIIIDHDFLTHQLADGGLRHRWLRQDGFAIAPTDWQDAVSCRGLDLLSDRFSSALTEHAFMVETSDHPKITDILSIQDDPIPEHLQKLLRMYCKSQFGDALDHELRTRIDALYP